MHDMFYDSLLDQVCVCLVIQLCPTLCNPMDFPGKESACNAGDLGVIPELGRPSGEGNGNTLVFLPGKSHGQRSLAGSSL